MKLFEIGTYSKCRIDRTEDRKLGVTFPDGKELTFSLRADNSRGVVRIVVEASLPDVKDGTTLYHTDATPEHILFINELTTMLYQQQRDDVEKIRNAFLDLVI